MIIVRLIGGLGNQMFQYAAGLEVAHRNITTLKLDVSAFRLQPEPKRTFALGVFKLSPVIASRQEVISWNPHVGNIFSRLKRKYLDAPRETHYVSQKCFPFDPIILKVGDNIYLEGFWQSAKHFPSIISILKKDFAFASPMSKAAKGWAKLVTTTNSVSLHIRHGDYLSVRVTNDRFNVVGLDYYLKAISIIKKRVNSPRFFVFSDDIAWARSNLPSNLDIHFVENQRDVDDLRLMSYCSHNIIANSSFSWWGSWLNENQTKIVIAPRQWMNVPFGKSSDWTPPGWLRI